MQDHAPLDPGNANSSRLWNTRYLDEAVRLAGNVSTIAAKNAPHAALWLSETDSICHQGVYNDTNAYLNSVWLVNRLGSMAALGSPVMARQSLVGYNYSLLGNWPLEQISPNPDFFTTVLFRRLVGSAVISTTITPPPLTATAAADTAVTAMLADIAADRGSSGSDDLPGDRARAFAFCTCKGSGCGNGDGNAAPDGAITLAFVNFGSVPAEFVVDLPGARLDYILTPGGHGAAGPYPFTSREIALNGRLLHMSPDDALPAMPAAPPAPPGSAFSLPPLTVGFAVFPVAGHPACM